MSDLSNRGHSGRAVEPEYRDDYPLSEAIADAYTEGLSDGQSWSSTVKHTDDRDYAMARADRLESSLAAVREAFEDLALWAPRQAGYAAARVMFVRRIAAALGREEPR